MVTLDEMKARQQAVATQREKELALGKANKSHQGEGKHGRHGGVHKVCTFAPYPILCTAVL